MKKEIKLKPGTIKELQRYIDAKIKERSFEKESLNARLLLLSEEFGEVIKSVRHLTGAKVKKDKKVKDNIGHELADVINLIFAVGIKLDLDIEKDFLEKEKIIDARKYILPKK
jgi:NTP pyrophosphatase (non-canonical NTP hydrolase)